ncbi:MAG: hypothetical protein RJB37_768 [Pseudomonadota bacterium]
MKRVLTWGLGGLLGVLALGAAAIAWLDAADAPPSANPRPVATDAAAIDRGRYLAQAGNCAACHTRRGEPPYAGGEALVTPFGTVYGGNLTPRPSAPSTAATSRRMPPPAWAPGAPTTSGARCTTAVPATGGC